MHLTVEQLDQHVLAWLKQARSEILAQEQHSLNIAKKTGRRDLVTNVDKLIERYYVKQIHQLMPQAKIVSEEGYGDDVTDLSGDVWFVDPIDGTLNFVEQHDEFATMLALYHDGQPVLAWIMDVMHNQVIHGGPKIGLWCNNQRITQFADKSLADGLMIVSGARLLTHECALPQVAKTALGFRVYGSAGISYIHVLLGKALGYISVMHPWDFAPGVALAMTLGLNVSNIDGNPLNMLLLQPVVVSTPNSHEDIMRIEKQTNGV